MMRNQRHQIHTNFNFNSVLYDNEYTHVVGLNDVLDPQNILDYYHFDPEYEINEYKNKLYCQIHLKIYNEEYALLCDTDDLIDDSRKEHINKLNLKELKKIMKQIVRNSSDYETCASLLMNLQISSGLEKNVCNIMINFLKHSYTESIGHTAQILCQLNSSLIKSLELLFIDIFTNVFALKSLRNIDKFFGYLLFTDTISWMVLSKIQLNKINTNSSRRTYIRSLFQELLDHMGLQLLNIRIKDLFRKSEYEEYLVGNNILPNFF